MLEPWETFYLIVGSSGGALIGTMFVVATLTAGIDSPRRIAQGARVYITPIVFHLSIILVVSAMAAVPDMSAPVLGACVAACAAIGLIYSLMTTLRMFRGTLDVLPTEPDLSDKWFYGLLPILIYIALAAVAAAMWLVPLEATYALGIMMLVLLLVSIRNAWDLATFMVQRNSDKAK